MQFTVVREALLKPLQAIMGVVERRQTLPILANLRVEADQTGLSLTATDTEVELRARVGTTVAAIGQTTLPARKLLDIVRNLPEGATLEVQIAEERASIRSGRSRFSMGVLPAADFPVAGDIVTERQLTLPKRVLREVIARTHFCMATQDVRYYLNGLLLEMEGVKLRAVATDGHRLAYSSVELDEGSSGGGQVIIPRKGVQELLRLLGDDDEGIHLELGDSHVRVALEDLRFTSKLIDGRFPEYRKVMPSAEGSFARLDREALRQALVRVSILSNERYRGVRMDLDAESLTVQSNNPEREEAEEVIAADFNGSAVSLGFNASYMLDALSAMESEAVLMFVTDADSSALVHGESEPESQYVIMPMRL